MYNNNKKIVCYIGDSRYTFIIPDTSSITVQSMNVFDNPVNMTIDDIVPIRVDIYPIDADNVLPVFEISNSIIADIKMGTIIPKQVGNTSIIVKTPNGKSIVGTISLTVTDAPQETVISEAETYNVILANHSISNDGVTETADNFNSMLVWAKNQGYKKVVMPTGTYLIGSTKYITLLSDMVLDLGGSILQQEASSGTNIKLVVISSGTANCRLTNGTLRGDRDSRESTDNQEFIHGIMCNGDHVELDNLTIEKVLGYGLAIGYGDKKTMAYISKDNLMEVSTNNWTTKNYIDISSFTNNLMVCNPFGYGNWGYINDTAVIAIRFYDTNKNLISEVPVLRPYREVSIPSGAKYVMIDLMNTAILGSNTDFGNSVTFLAEYEPSDYVNVHDCNMQYCKSLGLAYSGQGTHNVISNCTFNYNGGANATADVDLEDGWEHMRCLVFKGCTFGAESTRSMVICAGEAIVLYGNTFHGAVGIDRRAYNTRVIDNIFDFSTTYHVEINCEWYSSAVFLEGNVFNTCWCVFSNTRDKKRAQRFYFKDNTFNGGGLINQSTHEVFKNLTVSKSTQLSGNFENTTVI